ncbi:Putative ribonuclease H protein At1g65750 [Linum perenne]
MWKPRGSMQIIDVDMNCYLVRFGEEKDYFNALTGGPWLIFDHYLVVQQWDPSFRVSTKLPSKMVVWGQICTHDLGEPLAPGVELDGAWQRVEYENLPELCFTCGKIGHQLESCPTSAPAISQPTNTADSRVTTPVSVNIPVDAPPTDEYVPWLTVTRKGRRHRQEGTENGKSQKRNVEGLNDPPKSGGSTKGETSGIKHASKEAASMATSNAKSEKDSPSTGVLFKERKGKQGKGKATAELKQVGPKAEKSPVTKLKDRSPPASVKTSQSRPNPPTGAQAERSDPIIHQASDCSDLQDLGNPPSTDPPPCPNGLFPPAPPPTDTSPRQPLSLRRSKNTTPSRRIPPFTKPKKARGKKSPLTAPAKGYLKDWMPPDTPTDADTEVDLSLYLKNDSSTEPILMDDEMLTNGSVEDNRSEALGPQLANSTLTRSQLMAILEPRISGIRGKKVRDKMHFDSSIIVEAEGFKGGIWLLWPKSQGGLGLKKARELNEAYMMKMGWLILQKPEKLWVEVITSKYLKNTEQGLTVRRKIGCSTLWQGIRKTWSAMAGACQHSVRNGKSTLFWHHRWLDSDVRLADWATQPFEDTDAEKTVADVTTRNVDWNWSYLQSHLPPSCLEQIPGMEAPLNDDTDDEMIWGPDPKGKFSISSVYEIGAALNNDSNPTLWKRIWKWQGPNRIKHFLWLVAHNRLLTNSEWKRRHMTDNDCCRLCQSSTSTSLHVFRDCLLAKRFWSSFFPLCNDPSFFAGTIQEWIHKFIEIAEFSLQFGVALWLLWKARNEDIFEGKKVTSDQLRLRVHSWIAGVRETMKASSLILSENSVPLPLDLKPHGRLAVGGDPNTPSRHGLTLHRIRELRNRDWDVYFTHTFREGASHRHSTKKKSKILTLAKPLLESTVIGMMNGLPKLEKLGIANLGCSSGPNTFGIMSNILVVIKFQRGTMGRPIPELSVFLNDHPSNDFNNVLGSLLPQFQKVLMEEDNKIDQMGCFVSATPGSFYGRLFPRNSLHFVHSSSALES